MRIMNIGSKSLLVTMIYFYMWTLITLGYLSIKWDKKYMGLRKVTKRATVIGKAS